MQFFRRLGQGLRVVMLAVAMLVSLSQVGRAAEATPVPPGPMGDREVTIVNKSKQTINEVYVSPAHADDWGDDRLGDDTIDPGDNFRVRLGRMRECGFDVHIVYEDGSKEASLNNNVCRNRQIVVDGSNAVAPPPREEHTVVIVNAAGRPIQMVFISPAESNDWGEDRLVDDSISVGAEKRVTYRGDCAADLRIVFDNRSAEERKGLNLCDTPRISIEPGWTTADAVPTGDAARPGPAPDAVTPTPPASPPAPPPRAAATLEVIVINHTGHDAAELYVFPADAADHGPDRLGMSVLRQNDQVTLHIPKGDQCRFAAHVVYAGQTQDADVTGLDLCATPQITLPP